MYNMPIVTSYSSKDTGNAWPCMYAVVVASPIRVTRIELELNAFVKDEGVGVDEGVRDLLAVNAGDDVRLLVGKLVDDTLGVLLELSNDVDDDDSVGPGDNDADGVIDAVDSALTPALSDAGAVDNDVDD